MAPGAGGATNGLAESRNRSWLSRSRRALRARQHAQGQAARERVDVVSAGSTAAADLDVHAGAQLDQEIAARCRALGALVEPVGVVRRCVERRLRKAIPAHLQPVV